MQHTTSCTSLRVEGRVDFVFRNGFISRVDEKPFMWRRKTYDAYNNFIAIYDDANEDDYDYTDFTHSSLLRFTNTITHLEITRHSTLLLDYSTIHWSNEVTIDVKATSELRLTNEQPFQRPSKLNLHVSEQSVFAAAADASTTLRWHVKNLSLKVVDSYVSNLRASTSLAIDVDYMSLVFVHVSETIADAKVTHNERQGSNVYVTSKSTNVLTAIRCTTCTRLKQSCPLKKAFEENRVLAKFSKGYIDWRNAKLLVVNNETIAYNMANNQLKASRKRKEPPANALLPVLHRPFLSRFEDYFNGGGGGGGGGGDDQDPIEDVHSAASESFASLYQPVRQQPRRDFFPMPPEGRPPPRVVAAIPNPLDYQITLLNPDGVYECTICCEATINVQVSPCMHSYSCRNCAVEYKDLGKYICGICRGQIKEIVPLLIQMPSYGAKHVKREVDAPVNVESPAPPPSPPAATTTSETALRTIVVDE